MSTTVAELPRFRSFRGRARVCLVGVGAGLAVVLARPGWISDTAHHLGRADVRWLAVAVVCGSASVVAAGLLQRQLLLAGGGNIARGSILSITYASNALSGTLPLAGSAAGAAYTYRQLHRRGADRALVAWAMTMAGIVSTSILAVLVGIAGVASDSTAAATLGVVGILLGTAPMAVVLVASRSSRTRDVVVPAAVAVAARIRRLARPRAHPTTTTTGTSTSSVDHTIDPSIVGAIDDAIQRFSAFRLDRPAAIRAVSLAVANWTLDAACLAACLAAVGSPLPWTKLAIVYAAGVGASTLSISPAGIGVVEAVLSLSLVEAGVPVAAALPAAIAFRCTSSWIQLAAGWTIHLVGLRSPRPERRRIERVATMPAAASARRIDPLSAQSVGRLPFAGPAAAFCPTHRSTLGAIRRAERGGPQLISSNRVHPASSAKTAAPM